MIALEIDLDTKDGAISFLKDNNAPEGLLYQTIFYNKSEGHMGGRSTGVFHKFRFVVAPGETVIRATFWTEDAVRAESFKQYVESLGVRLQQGSIRFPSPVLNR